MVGLWVLPFCTREPEVSPLPWPCPGFVRTATGHHPLAQVRGSSAKRREFLEELMLGGHRDLLGMPSQAGRFWKPGLAFQGAATYQGRSS